MLDDEEFAAVWQQYQLEDRLLYPPTKRTETPREMLLRMQDSKDVQKRPEGTSTRQLRDRPLQDAYEKLTGLKFQGDDPKVIMHYRMSFYGSPCPHCGRLLRNKNAKQCFECSMDWHDPENVFCHKPKK
jgi:hypothetical protein